MKLFTPLILILSVAVAAETALNEELPVLLDEIMEVIASKADKSVLMNMQLTSKKMRQTAKPYLFLREKLLGSSGEKEIDISKVLEENLKYDRNPEHSGMLDGVVVKNLLSIISQKIGKNPYWFCADVVSPPTGTPDHSAATLLAFIHPHFSILPYICQNHNFFLKTQVLLLLSHLSGYDDLTIRIIPHIPHYQKFILCEKLIGIRGRGPVVDACLAELSPSDVEVLSKKVGPVELKNMDCIDTSVFPLDLSIALGGTHNLLEYMKNVGATDKDLADVVLNWVKTLAASSPETFVEEFVPVFLKVAHIDECKDACIEGFSNVLYNALEGPDDEKARIKIAIIKSIAKLDPATPVSPITNVFGKLFNREELVWFLDNWEEYQPQKCVHCGENVYRIVGPII